MTREIFWLTLTVVLTGLLWVPYILDRIRVRGLMGAHGQSRSPGTSRNRPGRSGSISPIPMRSTIWCCSRRWCSFSIRRSVSTDLTAAACAVYFWARLAHAVVYTAGIKVLRTLSFAVGWAACAVLVLAIFRVV